MNLEKLVADRELCEKIPAGEFGDTCFFWFNFGDGYTVCKNGKSGFADLQNAYPAPTLEEIIKNLSEGLNLVDCIKNFRGWEIDCMIGIDNPNAFDEKSGATAALKLWLELNKKGN